MISYVDYVLSWWWLSYTVAGKASALIAEILIVLIKKINVEPYTDLVG
jgi:hypothetical protein